MVNRKIVIYGGVLVLLFILFYFNDNFILSSITNNDNSTIEFLIYNGTGYGK